MYCGRASQDGATVDQEIDARDKLREYDFANLTAGTCNGTDSLTRKIYGLHANPKCEYEYRIEQGLLAFSVAADERNAGAAAHIVGMFGESELLQEFWVVTVLCNKRTDTIARTSGFAKSHGGSTANFAATALKRRSGETSPRAFANLLPPALAMSRA